MAHNFMTDFTVSDSGFLFDHASGQTFTLNPTGKFILDRMKTGEDHDAILPLMMKEFEVNETTARRDLDDFNRQLRELEIVE